MEPDLVEDTKRKATLTTIVATLTILSTLSVVYLPFEKASASLPAHLGLVQEGNGQDIKHHILFKNDYSSNAGWTQIGNSVTVNSPSFPGSVKWNNGMEDGAAGYDAGYKHYTTA